jgi:large subunit ribosomal protein L19
MGAAIALKSVSPVKVEERKNLDIRAGDVVRVHQKIKEKGKVRLQVFEGLVLARKHGTEPGATFTVRAVLQGIGVEKIFPLYSPMIDKIEIVRRSKVRRAKLYYIRDKVAREQRRQLRKMSAVSISTGSGDDDDAVADDQTTDEPPIEIAEPTPEEAKAIEAPEAA